MNLNGPALAAFMEGYQRTMAQQQQQRLQRDELTMRQQDRDAMFSRQAEQDRIAAEERERQAADRERAMRLQSLEVAPRLAEIGGAAQDPASAQRLIESMMPDILKVFGPDALAYGQPAVEMATQTITARQKKDVERYVEQLTKTAYIAEHADTDPLVDGLPEHIQKIVGKPSAKLSELQRFAALPVGKPAVPKSTANPTEASLALAAAGGDPVKAFGMLNPPKPGGSSEPKKQEWVLRNGEITPIQPGTARPGDRPYNETTQRQNDQTDTRNASVASAADEALALVRALKTKPGMSGAVGAKGPTSLFGFLDRPMAGTDAAGYRQSVDTLLSKLTIPAMQQMRGLGAMSDREFRTMRDSVSLLSTDLKESAFLAELDKLETQLQGVVNKLQIRSAAPAMNAAVRGGDGSVKVGQFTVRVKP